MSRVSIAYTTVGDEDIPLQVHVDFEGYKIERELTENLWDARQYSSLQELIENELEGLDFQELAAVRRCGDSSRPWPLQRRKLPLLSCRSYRQNAAYAREHGELEQYRVSHQGQHCLQGGH